jgi:outer membrane protein assembly factor BamB
MDTTNKPVAWLSPDKKEICFLDESVKPKTSEYFAHWMADWERLYTHPNQHDLGIAEAVGFDKGYQAATARSQEPDSYGDGTVYRGVRSGDSEVKTYVFDEHAGKQTWSTPVAKTLTDAEFDNIFANGKRLGVLETEDRFRKAMNLTDEEITEVINNIAYYGSIAKNDYVNFARAILRKAQEK